MSCCWVPFVIVNCTVLPRTFLCMLFFFQRLSLMVPPFPIVLGCIVCSLLVAVGAAVAGNAACLFHKVLTYPLQFRVKFWLYRNVFDKCRRVKGSLQRTFAMKMPVVAFQRFAKCCDKILWQQASRGFSSNILPPTEIQKITAAFTSKALETIALGNLPPGKELELISALDVGTVTWDQLPVKLKEKLKLPRRDRGIDSMSLDLKRAVQAKDYANGTVDLKDLATFHFLVKAEHSTLKEEVQEMIVATSKGTKLPELWDHLSGATHRAYSPDEMETWRKKAQKACLEKTEVATSNRKALPRWPHQKDCLKQCRKFLQNKSTLAKRDFFVQIATGAGKSLIMSDLLDSPKRACVIVPKLDLMEQMAQLLEEIYPSKRISRVGTGCSADLTADIFVCVDRSACRLADLAFDLILLDEAHHYEQLPDISNVETVENFGDEMTPTQQVLALKAQKRMFFTATLTKNAADFDFGLRPAIEAGVIQDYSVMVPVLSEGDPRPGLVKLIQNLLLSRKILAFCNTVQEAQDFKKMLIEAGIAAEHYNSGTATSIRQDILQSFQQPETQGGIRVLVTVDVLSEGVDLPVADTCMLVAPRRGVRLRQCVGRVLRKHPTKIDALVIAPPIVRKADDLLSEEPELTRLLSELVTADPKFKNALETRRKGDSDTCHSRLDINTSGMLDDDLESSLIEKAAEVLQIHVLPYVLDSSRAISPWDVNYQKLVAYKAEHGHVKVPVRYKAPCGFSLGDWVSKQRAAKARGMLDSRQIELFNGLDFVWRIREVRKGGKKWSWDSVILKLKDYKAEHGHLAVLQRFRTADDCPLGEWVRNRRQQRRSGRLDKERIEELDSLGFIWDGRPGSGVRKAEKWDAERLMYFAG